MALFYLKAVHFCLFYLCMPRLPQVSNLYLMFLLLNYPNLNSQREKHPLKKGKHSWSKQINVSENLIIFLLALHVLAGLL